VSPANSRAASRPQLRSRKMRMFAHILPSEHVRRCERIAFRRITW
jgi:hypothetical protein